MAELFKFRKFDVFQKNSLMKVGTDGVLLGALVKVDNCDKIIDVGAGTGVVSMMLAQRSNAHIIGVEIDGPSFKECRLNFQNHPKSDLLEALNEDFIKVDLPPQSFDLIVSNPPFFKDSPTLKQKKDLKNPARHQISIGHKDLIVKSINLLKEDGCIAVILPIHESREFKLLCLEQGLYCNREIDIIGRRGKSAVRRISTYSTSQVPTIHESITLELDKRHEYSKEYLSLMRDFLFLE